jgi:hypothetical protein
VLVDRACLSRAAAARTGRLVGYVGDFDLAEESTQDAFAIALRLPGTTATISGSVFSVAQVPSGASNARAGTDAGTNMPTHRGPAEDELR